jgi:hypothetical protein
MRYLKYLGQFMVVFMLAATSWIFYTWFVQKEEISQFPKSSQPTIAKSNDNLQENMLQKKMAQAAEDFSAESPSNDNSMSQQSNIPFRSLASRIEEYQQLPTEADKDWVLENVANSLKAGLIKQEQLPTHISELSSVRMFTVLDRTSPYVDSESFDGTEPEYEEGL